MAKAKRKSLTAQEEEYQLKYGGLPNETEDLLKYVLEKYPFTDRAFEKAMSYQEGLEWKTVEFVMYLVPKPSPRPRTNGNHFYVKGAAQNKKIIKKFIEKHIMFTRTEIAMEAYLPTPTSSMTNAEIYLAEKKRIFPEGSCDVDNLMKTYLDMIQGHLLLNDNIVTCGLLEKFYSVKPRLKVSIRYQTRFDSRYNEKRITRTRAFSEEFGDESPNMDEY